jgi:hypothetical protein
MIRGADEELVSHRHRTRQSGAVQLAHAKNLKRRSSFDDRSRSFFINAVDLAVSQ